MKHLVLYEVKKGVSAHLSTVNEKNLAQTIVEGYYCLLGCGVTYIIVALTDIATTHYFKLKLLTTGERKLEVIWYYSVTFPVYPPTSAKDLTPFLHGVKIALDDH